MNKIEIITPRLLLRSPVPEDAEAAQRAKEEIWHDLQTWMSWAFDENKYLQSARDYFADSAKRKKGSVLLGFLRDGGDFVISASLDHIRDEEYLASYWVARRHQGRGYATEATNAVLRYAFGALKADVVNIDYCEGNEKSAHIIRKLGFTPRGIIKRGLIRPLDNTFVDVHHFQRVNTDGLPELDVSWT